MQVLGTVSCYVSFGNWLHLLVMCVVRVLSQQQLGRLDETMCTNNNGAVNVVIAGVPCMCVQCTWIAGCPEVLALQLWCCCCWEETTMSGTMTNR